MLTIVFKHIKRITLLFWGLHFKTNPCFTHNTILSLLSVDGKKYKNTQLYYSNNILMCICSCLKKTWKSIIAPKCIYSVDNSLHIKEIKLGSKTSWENYSFLAPKSTEPEIWWVSVSKDCSVAINWSLTLSSFLPSHHDVMLELKDVLEIIL